MKPFLKLSLPIFLLVSASVLAQIKPISFGTETTLEQLFSMGKEKPINWINVNTDPDTWRKVKDILVCSGLPIGVMRSEKQYENFILMVEWRHMEAGGNSGVFVWSDAKPWEKDR